MLEEDRVHPVLERATVLDQVQPEARPLAFGPHGRIGQPDLGHQVEPRELGEHPTVDPVGLARQRRQPACLDRVRDPHVPAAKLELVVHEAGAAHRLDHRQHRLRVAQSLHQPDQPVTIRRRRADRDPLALPVERLPIKTLAAQIQSDVQHRLGPPFVLSRTRGVSLRGRPSFIRFLGVPHGRRL